MKTNIDITKGDVLAAQKVLIDNGIEPDESGVVLQALSSILLGVDIDDLIEWNIRVKHLPNYCEETVNIWLEGLAINGTDIDEEIEEVKGAISNEELWLRGTFDDEEAFFHAQHLADLVEYLSRLSGHTVQ